MLQKHSKSTNVLHNIDLNCVLLCFNYSICNEVQHMQI